MTGLQIFDSWVRPHKGLNGGAPADKAGIKVEEENKWFTLVQNASRN